MMSGQELRITGKNLRLDGGVYERCVLTIRGDCHWILSGVALEACNVVIDRGHAAFFGVSFADCLLEGDWSNVRIDGCMFDNTELPAGSINTRPLVLG